MPIVLVPMPEEIEFVAKTGVLPLLEKHSSEEFAPNTRTVVSGEALLAVPHFVYTLGLSQAAEKGSPREPVTARYLVCDGDVPVGAAEIANLNGRGFEVHRFDSPSESLVSMGRALTHIGQQLEVDIRPYELRLLRVPGLYLTAIWLYNQEVSFAIPLVPAFAPFEAERLYPFGELQDLMGEAAREKLLNLGNSDSLA